MKKRYFPLLLVLFVATVTQAQNTFNNGDKVLNLGIGFGSTLYSGSFYTSRTPPISASLEVGVKDELFDEKSSLGVGGYLGYTGAKWRYANSDYGFDYSSIVIGGRGSLHYQLVEKLDSYTGLMLGYNIVSSKTQGQGESFGSATGSALVLSWYLGGRYYFSDNVAALLELGYGVAYANIGVAFKF